MDGSTVPFSKRRASMTWLLNSANDSQMRRASAGCAGSAIVNEERRADAMNNLIDILVDAVVKEAAEVDDAGRTAKL
jgi:hypothetical protein